MGSNEKVANRLGIIQGSFVVIWVPFGGVENQNREETKFFTLRAPAEARPEARIRKS